jgi:hypothetical protein
MRKANVLLAVLVLEFLASALVGFQTVRAQDVSDENPNYGYTITSPLSNQTYTTGLLTLKIAFLTFFGPNSNFGSDGYYFITYSIDGGEIRIPKASISYELSKYTFDFNHLEATAILPQLTEGYHTLTVTAREPYIIKGHSGYYYHKDRVDFAVAQPLTIMNLSIKNETYKQNSLNLNFTTDQPTSWMAYSIDEQANMTINGNASLTELTSGQHNITIYANSTFGSIGKSETVNFTIANEPEPFPIIAATIFGVFVAITLVVCKSISRNTSR